VFFLTTNFGARQNKGLGCFSLVEVNGVREQSMSDSELLKNYFGTQAVYKIVYNKQTDVVDIINEATFIYQILKSGNNNGVYIKSFITEWFWDKGLASEKRLLKQKGVSPAEYKPANEQYRPRANGTPEEGRYIRSMLGITGAISYIDKVDSSGNAVTVNKNGKDIPVKDNIKIDSISKDKIERLASPIVFSIHNNTLYIIPYEPDDVIFDADFRFQIKLDRNASFRPRANEIVISTPSKDEFSMAQLIADYVAHLNASGTNIDKYHSFACKMNKPNRYPRLMYKEQRLAVKKL